MKVTEDQWRRAASLYRCRQLLTYVDVANELNISPARVCQVFRNLGIRAVNANGPPSRVDAEEAKSLRLQGWTFNQIGKYFGVSRSRIYQILRDKTDYYDEDEELAWEPRPEFRLALMLNDGMRPEMAQRLLGLTSCPTM